MFSRFNLRKTDMQTVKLMYFRRKLLNTYNIISANINNYEYFETPK